MFSSLITKIFLVLSVFIISMTPPASAANSGFAVVLIDMQEGFYQGGGAVGSQGLRKLVYNQSRLLAWAVQNSIPVIVLEYESFGPTDPNLMKIVKLGKYAVIEKNRDGGFDGKSRNAILAALASEKIDSLIIAGVNGPYCVKSTIVGALAAGFNVMTTAWVIGNINYNPPTFPNGSWYFKNTRFTVFPTLESIIR